MPAIDFQGIDAGVVWTDFSPRIGATYDIKGDGKTVVSSSYATYYGQMAPGRALEPARRHRRGVRPLSLDRHQRRHVRAGRTRSTPRCRSSARATPTTRPTRPTPWRRRASIADIKNDRTREFIVGFDRQVGSQMAFGASYIWRKYDQFALERSRELDDRPTIARCRSRRPAARRRALRNGDLLRTDHPAAVGNALHQLPGPFRDFNGFELTFAKRMANRWSMNASYAYNDAVDVFDSPARSRIRPARRHARGHQHRSVPGHPGLRAGIGRQRHRQRVPELEVAA